MSDVIWASLITGGLLVAQTVLQHKSARDRAKDQFLLEQRVTFRHETNLNLFGKIIAGLGKPIFFMQMYNLTRGSLAALFGIIL